MKHKAALALVISLVYGQSGLTQPTPLAPVASRMVAELTLKKGLSTVDLGHYTGSLLMHGLSEFAVTHNDPAQLQRARELFGQFKDQRIRGRGSFISYEAGGTGAAYLLWKKRGPELSDQVAFFADKMHRTQKQSSEGILTANWAIDSMDQVFIDVAFAVTPYLLYSGLALNQPAYVDKAVFETTELFRLLEDRNGLLRQARGFRKKGIFSQDNWSRGNGWGAYALAILVRDLPDSHPRKKGVDALAKRFFTAVLKHQNPNGLWHQEMTDTTSYVEVSGSGLLLYSLGIALEKNIIDKSNRVAIQRGLSGLLDYVAADGSISHVCGGCLYPGQGTKAEYMAQKWKVNDGHAFGPLVLAFTQADKLGIRQVKPRTRLGYHLVGSALGTQPRTYLRYMPEANGNILWENDRIAFRVYGPPVKNRVSSGIDVWTKSVSYPIIDKWYELSGKGQEYHVDRGEGCDFFHVGFGRGNGGTAVWHNGKPYISQPYSTHRILVDTPEEIAFELIFDPWEIDGGSAGRFKVSERKEIRMKLGTNLFRVTSTFQTDWKEPLTIGLGISFVGKPQVDQRKETGSLILWESYLPTNGELGTGIIANPAQVEGFRAYEKDQFMLLKVRPGEPVTYYVGAGWTKSPQFRTKADWVAYLERELPRLTF
jgi:rhamnogalacturonyl hydrolase YesR